MLVLIEHTSNGSPQSTRVRTWSSGRRWPQHPATWMLVCITCPGKTRHRDARWGEGELAEAAIHFTSTRAAYPEHCCGPWAPFHGHQIPWFLFRQHNALCPTAKMAQEWSDEYNNKAAALPRLEILRSQSKQERCACRTLLSCGGAILQLTGLKMHLQITSCCQIPQHSSMAQDYFGTKGRLPGRCVYT